MRRRGGVTTKKIHVACDGVLGHKKMGREGHSLDKIMDPIRTCTESRMGEKSGEKGCLCIPVIQ